MHQNSQPMKGSQVDYVGPLPVSEGSKQSLVYVDISLTWPKPHPIATQTKQPPLGHFRSCIPGVVHWEALELDHSQGSPAYAHSVLTLTRQKLGPPGSGPRINMTQLVHLTPAVRRHPG